MKILHYFDDALLMAGMFSCVLGLPYAIAGALMADMPEKAELRMPVEIMVHDAIAKNKAIITDSDCEHAEKVLVAYALELRQQGKTDSEIQKALNELAKEY